MKLVFEAVPCPFSFGCFYNCKDHHSLESSCYWVIHISESDIHFLSSWTILFVCYVQDNSDPQSERFDKRYGDIDYDSFIGLMGRRSAGETQKD